MRVLFDTDVVLKLAALDLLSEACVALGTLPSAVCVPPDSIYKLRKDRGGKLAARYGEAGLARAIAFLGQAASCDVDPELFADLNAFAGRADVTGLDEGEVVLLAMTPESGDFLLASGDKRWPPALQRDEPVCVRLNARLKGTVVCFEQTVLRLILHVGFEPMRAAFLRRPTCDESLRQVFTSRPETVEQPIVVEGLFDTIGPLRARSGALLVDDGTLVGQLR